NYRFYHFIPAYILVFLLFISTIYIETFKRFIQKPYNRLFLSLAVASILLSNHELFMKPMQPIHFARGYEWTAYFLMGVPALHLLINRLNTKKIFLYAFLGIMLLDNFLWIFNYTRFTRSNASISQISDEQKNVLNTIRKNSDEETLIIGGDETIPYLTTIYSKAYPWISHPYTTPYAAEKTLAYNNFIQNGKVDDKWLNRKLI